MTLASARFAGPALALFLGLAAAGCTAIPDRQGYVMDPVLVSAIQPGIDNQQSVQATLGRPTFTGQFTEVGIGASVYSGGGAVSGFLNLGGRFGDDYQATTASAGVRVNW